MTPRQGNQRGFTRRAFGRGLLGALGALGPLGALGASGCRGHGAGEVVLGALCARTGERALWGEDLFRGIELAVVQANARGGLLGRRVRLAAEDDGSRDDRAGAAVTQLCAHEGAIAVLGEVSSAASDAGATAAQRRGVPFVATAASARDVARMNDFAFRTALTDAEQAAALARYVRQAQQKRRAAVVYRRNSLLNLATGDAFAHAFRTSGGDVMLHDTFTDDDADLVHLAGRVRASGADVLFVPAVASDAARVALAMRHGRANVQLAGTDGWDAPELRRFAPEAVAGAVITNAFVPGASRPEVDQFVQAFREKYQAEPGTCAALGYDAARWVLSVAARVPTLDTRALRDALAGSQLEDGVAGPLAVDARRVLTRPANVLRVEREGYTFLATASP